MVKSSKGTAQPKKLIRFNLRDFLIHLKRLKSAKAEVDHKPSSINVNSCLRLYQLGENFNRIVENSRKNKELLLSLAEMFLKPAAVCPPVSADAATAAGLKNSSRKVLKDKLMEIEAANSFMQFRLDTIKNAKKPKDTPTSTSQQPAPLPALPAHLIKRFSRFVNVPKSVHLQNKIFRPRIFFELAASDEREFGRVSFQIFTEACPVMIMQLLRFFANGDCKRITFPRLHASLWAEVEIPLGREKLDCYEFYDMNVVDCGSQPGILCFALQDFDLLRQGTLVFSISFRPITVNDGKRFAFGKLISGGSRFLCLNEYSTKRGKPLKEIRVTNMGIL